MTAPALDDRCLELLRSLHPGRRVTAAQLRGWLSVPESQRDVDAALEALHAARLAQRWKSKPDLWAAIPAERRAESARRSGAVLCHRRPLTHADLDAVDAFRTFLAQKGPRR